MPILVMCGCVWIAADMFVEDILGHGEQPLCGYLHPSRQLAGFPMNAVISAISRDPDRGKVAGCSYACSMRFCQNATQTCVSQRVDWKQRLMLLTQVSQHSMHSLTMHNCIMSIRGKPWDINSWY